MIDISVFIAAFISYTVGYVWGYIRGRSTVGKSAEEAK